MRSVPLPPNQVARHTRRHDLVSEQETHHQVENCQRRDQQRHVLKPGKFERLQHAWDVGDTLLLRDVDREVQRRFVRASERLYQSAVVIR